MTAKKSAASAAAVSAMVVKADESPWTTAEIAELRAEIDADIAALREELSTAEAGLNDLLRNSGEGAGDDPGDVGAQAFEREQEISLANNARDLLEQNLYALARLDAGSYGRCENCGEPIGKLRLQAAPRATLCMPCKKLQERR